LRDLIRHIKYLFIVIVGTIGVGIFLFAKIEAASIGITSLNAKREAVKVLQLPDLSLSNEAQYIRFRSVCNLFDVFGLGPSLLPYFPSDFVYSPPPYLNANGEIKVEY